MRKHLWRKLSVILIMMYFVSPAWGGGEIFNMNIYRPIGSLAYNKTAPVDEETAKKIEEIIGFWADAIFEASNGADKLGIIRIYQQTSPQPNIGSRERGPMHVFWRYSGTPGVVMAYGYRYYISSPQDSMGSILMYDIHSTDRFLTDPGGLILAGYALAHESGHYIYGLYDERGGIFQVAEWDTEQPYSVVGADLGMDSSLKQPQA